MPSSIDRSSTTFTPNIKLHLLSNKKKKQETNILIERESIPILDGEKTLRNLKNSFWTTERKEEKMNGFQLQADAYRQAAEQGKITQEQADKECKVFDFLATCDDDDICNLFNSSAFNEIAKSYMRIAVRELADEGTIDDEQAIAVRNRFALLFDEKRAQEVI